MTVRVARIALLGVVALLASCSTQRPSPPIETYDSDLQRLLNQQLLLNIARQSRDLPVHFAIVSSITDTYHSTISAAIGPTQSTSRTGLVAPMFTIANERNPTVGIAPMQGDDYTRQVLTPFSAQKLTLLLRQRTDVDALFRLLAAKIVLEDSNGQRVSYPNQPSERDSYIAFRQIVAQLSSIQDRRALYVEPIYVEHSWTVPASQVTPESAASTYKDYTLKFNAQAQTYNVTKRVVGRVAITNYDPARLPSAERARMQVEADSTPDDQVVLDLRPEFVGGEIPMHGHIVLRSFQGVLTFVGRGVTAEPEFAVSPDPRTPSIAENPVSTLGIAVNPTGATDEDLIVAIDGTTYALAPDPGYPWNRKAFALLGKLFQLSLSTSQVSSPTLLIPK